MAELLHSPHTLKVTDLGVHDDCLFQDDVHGVRDRKPCKAVLQQQSPVCVGLVNIRLYIQHTFSIYEVVACICVWQPSTLAAAYKHGAVIACLTLCRGLVPDEIWLSLGVECAAVVLAPGGDAC